MSTPTARKCIGEKTAAYRTRANVLQSSRQSYGKFALLQQHYMFMAKDYRTVAITYIGRPIKIQMKHRTTQKFGNTQYSLL